MVGASSILNTLYAKEHSRTTTAGVSGQSSGKPQAEKENRVACSKPGVNGKAARKASHVANSEVNATERIVSQYASLALQPVCLPEVLPPRVEKRTCTRHTTDSALSKRQDSAPLHGSIRTDTAGQVLQSNPSTIGAEQPFERLHPYCFCRAACAQVCSHFHAGFCPL